MRISLLAVLAALLLAPMTTTADARPHKNGYSGKAHATASYKSSRKATRRTASRSRSTASRSRSRGTRTASVARPAGISYLGVYEPQTRYSAGPRPGKWCGWWMRTQRGGGPEYNVAWNWRNYGRPGSPQVGAVVVWRHHVGEIVGQTADGRWLVRSGNDGGAVRTRPRSIAGAVIRV